jgi:hypothetical protein
MTQMAQISIARAADTQMAQNSVARAADDIDGADLIALTADDTDGANLKQQGRRWRSGFIREAWSALALLRTLLARL